MSGQEVDRISFRLTWEDALQIRESLLEPRLSLRLLLINTSLQELVMHVNQLLIQLSLKFAISIVQHPASFRNVIKRKEYVRDSCSLCLLIIQILPRLRQVIIQLFDFRFELTQSSLFFCTQ